MNLQTMVIGSVDTLRGHEVDLRVPETWNDRPPLLSGPRGREETPMLLKGMLRKGVPPVLRCAIWLSNVIQTVHPQQESEYWHEYRTLAKVRALDHAYDCLLKQIISGSSTASDDNGGRIETDPIWSQLQAPSYGQTSDAANAYLTITDAGKLSRSRVLIALERVVVGMEVAPLIPSLASLLLISMAESYCFCAMREMAHCVGWYFPVSQREHDAWCRAFADVLRKLHTSTAQYLEDRNVLPTLEILEGSNTRQDGFLRPIFQDMFLGILPIEYVLRIVDIYTLEGGKVLFRFGVALLVLYKVYSAEQLLTISNADEWWNGLRQWTHSNNFNFEVVVRKAYGVHGKVRRQLRFPRRSILDRIIRMEEERLEEYENSLSDSGVAAYKSLPSAPLGLAATAETAIYSDEEEIAVPIFGKSMETRLSLAEWLPLALKMTNLQLLYSTNHHGRSLDIFYKRVKNSKHTVLLCEVLGPLSNGHQGASDDSKPTIVGMYASQAWRISNQVYGDGGCFLFQVSPNAACYKWSPHKNSVKKTHSELLDSIEEEMLEKNNKTALLEQFMVGTSSYISMGGNPDGSAGLRFNEDFTKGESSRAAGFENEPLHGSGKGSVFEVGLVEVYGLVRQMDGRAA